MLCIRHFVDAKKKKQCFEIMFILVFLHNFLPKSNYFHLRMSENFSFNGRKMAKPQPTTIM